MTSAARLYAHDFAGANTPGVVDPWPGFQFPIEKGPGALLNPQSGAQSGINGIALTPYINEPFIPTIDGHGKGIGPVGFAAFAYVWLLRSGYWPGRSDYQSRLWGRWKAPGRTTYAQSIGNVVRLRDNSNYLVARVTATAVPSLKLFKVIAGVATQLGATHTGADVGTTGLQNGVRTNVVPVDNADGTTTVTVYTSPVGAESRGTSRITYTGAIPELRGPYGTGVELTAISGDDCWVDDHEVYDLSDGGAPLGDGSNWIVELAGTRYTRAELANHTPKVHDVRVTQRMGAETGSQCEILAEGDWVLQAGLRPGMLVRVFHHGACRFRGTIVGGQTGAKPAESQSWTALDAMAAAALVDVAEDDGTLTIYFNVLDTTSDYYFPDRQNKTIGYVIAWLFERYREKLLLHGVIPPDADAFVQAELDLMNAVIPGLTLSGNFAAVIAQLVARLRKFQPITDQETGTWHFLDIVDGTTEQPIECTADWVLPTVTADSRRAVTAIEFIGTRQEEEDTTLTRGVPGTPDSLGELWTPGQAAGTDASKKGKRSLTGKIVAGAGAEAFHGVVRCFFMFTSPGLVEDEWRGAMEMALHANGPQFVVGNTSTKVYLAAGAWPGGIAPAAGTPFNLTMLAPGAQAWLSTQGVGKAFRAFSPIAICGTGGKGPYRSGAEGGQACGIARVGQKNPITGEISWESIDFRVHAASAEAAGAGFCDTAIELAKPALRTIGLINVFGPGPGGSPPADQCASPATQQPDTIVSLTVKTLTAVPRVRRPAAEDTFEGAAFDEWGVRRLRRIPLPDFTNLATQGPGLELAAQHLLDVMGEKPLLFKAQLTTPWDPHPAFPDHADGYPTEQWAGLRKRVTLRSKKRTTGLESAVNLPVYAVTWSLLQNTTTLEAGTASGWLNLDVEAIAQTYLLKPEIDKQRQQLQNAMKALGCLLSKGVDVQGAQSAGPIPGCGVEVIDRVRRTSTSVELDDENKKSNIAHVSLEGKLARAAAGIGDVVYPGNPIEMPGFDGDGAAQIGPTGRIPRSLPTSPIQGPSRYLNGDIGRYGSPLVTNPLLAGKPPDEIAVFAWGTVRKKADGAGSREGAYDLEWSPNDAQGVPTGAWAPLTSLTSIAATGIPLKSATAGSYPQQLRDREEAVLERTGIRADANGVVLTPGKIVAGYATGVPVDLVTALAVAATASSHLRPRMETATEPSGLIFHGPVGPDGADAGLDWAVHPAARELVLVSDVGGGAGFNGSRWGIDTSGPGGSMTVLKSGGAVHKQIDAAALRSDAGSWVTAPSVPAAADSPHCFVEVAGRELPGGGSAKTGAGGIISMPPFTRGAIAVTAHLKEVLGSAEAAANVGRVRLSYAVQASAWTAASATAEADAVTTDGAGTGTGLATFLIPGGAVPAGLRKPFDLSVSIQRDAASGTMTGTAILTGIGVDLVVTETGYLFHVRESVGVAESIKDNQPWEHEDVAVVDTVVWKFTHPQTDSAKFIDDGRGVLDPALFVDDLVEVASAETGLLDQDTEADGAAITEHVTWRLT